MPHGLCALSRSPRNARTRSAAAASPADVMLEITFGGLATAAGVRTLSVDVGDDGTVELTEQSIPFAQLTATLTAQPLPVRVIIETTATSVGSNSLGLNLIVTPENDVQIDQAVFGCTNIPHDLVCVSGFTGAGVDFIQTPNYSATGVPVVLALGLGVQPVLLPAASPSLPCLLLPSIDATVVMPPVFQDPFNVELPPAVRPVTFWAQAVAVTPAGLRTTAGFRIHAQ